MVSLGLITPFIAVLSLLAGVIGSFIGVRFTANAAAETAKEAKVLVEDTRDLLGGLKTNVAVHDKWLIQLEKTVDRLVAAA